MWNCWSKISLPNTDLLPVPTNYEQVELAWWDKKRRGMDKLYKVYSDRLSSLWITTCFWTGLPNHSWLFSDVTGRAEAESIFPNAGWQPAFISHPLTYAYFHFGVLLLLRLLLWSWQRSLAGCSAVAPTVKTGGREPGLDPDGSCSGWLLCQVYGEFWAGLRMLGYNHHCWRGKEEEAEEEEEGRRC